MNQLHTPTAEKDEVAKKELYSFLEKVCEAVPNYNMKTVLGDFNTEVGKKSYLYPACGGHNLYNETNDNGKLMVNFALEETVSIYGHSQGKLAITWQQNM